MTLSKRASWFLIAVGVWSWIIWPTFLKNIWGDDRSWDNGPTGFFLVHLVLTVASLVIGTAVGWLGVRGVRGGRDRPPPAAPTSAAPTSDSPASGARSGPAVAGRTGGGDPAASSVAELVVGLG